MVRKAWYYRYKDVRNVYSALLLYLLLSKYCWRCFLIFIIWRSPFVVLTLHWPVWRYHKGVFIQISQFPFIGRSFQTLICAAVSSLPQTACPPWQCSEAGREQTLSICQFLQTDLLFFSAPLHSPHTGESWPHVSFATYFTSPLWHRRCCVTHCGGQKNCLHSTRSQPEEKNERTPP